MNRLTADQTTFPFTMGVMFVNEKPESTTRTHSDMGSVPRTPGCHGISDGPDVSAAHNSMYQLFGNKNETHTPRIQSDRTMLVVQGDPAPVP